MFVCYLRLSGNKVNKTTFICYHCWFFWFQEYSRPIFP